MTWNFIDALGDHGISMFRTVGLNDMVYSVAEIPPDAKPLRLPVRPGRSPTTNCSSWPSNTHRRKSGTMRIGPMSNDPRTILGDPQKAVTMPVRQPYLGTCEAQHADRVSEVGEFCQCPKCKMAWQRGDPGPINRMIDFWLAGKLPRRPTVEDDKAKIIYVPTTPWVLPSIDDTQHKGDPDEPESH